MSVSGVQPPDLATIGVALFSLHAILWTGQYMNLTASSSLPQSSKINLRPVNGRSLLNCELLGLGSIPLACSLWLISYVEDLLK